MYPERQQSTCSISLALVKSAESDLQFEEGKLNNSLMPEINPIKMTSICLKKSTLASDIPQLIDASLFAGKEWRTYCITHYIYKVSKLRCDTRTV